MVRFGEETVGSYGVSTFFRFFSGNLLLLVVVVVEAAAELMWSLMFFCAGLYRAFFLFSL